MKYISKTSLETKEIAYKLIERHKSGLVVCLYGDLGAGKTIFVKGMAEALNIPEKSIKSPTFTILREYKLNIDANKPSVLYHYDFYRHTELDPILIQQFEEYQATQNNYFFIEWAENIKNILPSKRVDVFLEHTTNPTHREITIKKQCIRKTYRKYTRSLEFRHTSGDIWLK